MKNNNLILHRLNTIVTNLVLLIAQEYPTFILEQQRDEILDILKDNFELIKKDEEIVK